MKISQEERAIANKIHLIKRITKIYGEVFRVLLHAYDDELQCTYLEVKRNYKKVQIIYEKGGIKAINKYVSNRQLLQQIQ